MYTQENPPDGDTVRRENQQQWRGGQVACDISETVNNYIKLQARARRNVNKGHPKTRTELQQTKTRHKQPADNPTGNAQNYR